MESEDTQAESQIQKNQDLQEIEESTPKNLQNNKQTKDMENPNPAHQHKSMEQKTQ